MTPFNTPTTTVESFLEAEHQRKQGEFDNPFHRFLLKHRIFCEAKPFCSSKANHVRNLDGHDYVLCDEHERLVSQYTDGKREAALDYQGTIFSKEADQAFQHQPIEQGEL